MNARRETAAEVLAQHAESHWEPGTFGESHVCTCGVVYDDVLQGHGGTTLAQHQEAALIAAGVLNPERDAAVEQVRLEASVRATGPVPDWGTLRIVAVPDLAGLGPHLTAEVSTLEVSTDANANADDDR